MKTRIVKSAKNMAVLALLICSQGCESPTKLKDLRPEVGRLANNTATAKIITNGECADDNLVYVSARMFRLSLVDAVDASGLFQSQGNANDEPDFTLEVSVTGFKPPKPGFAMHAFLTTRWRLTRTTDNRELYDDTFQMKYTAGTGEAFSGMERSYRANEGVVRATLKEGLTRISKLDLKTP